MDSIKLKNPESDFYSGGLNPIYNNRRRKKVPRGDGTGPQGKGAKTGRQMGSCKGAKSMGYGSGGGKGRGAGRGKGAGKARGK